MRRALVLLALAFGGCGLGAGDDAGEVHVAITRDYGAAAVSEPANETFREDESLLKLLERTHDIETGFGGAFVESLDGVKGGGKDWFFFVNGQEATKGAGDIALRPGDRVWWDHHAWSEDVRVPAVIGSFPQPFAGRTARVECAAAAATCETVRSRLTAAGAKVADNGELRVVVGPLKASPDGGFARVEDADIELLDLAGDPKSVLPAGGGLVTADADAWYVTGADEAGIAAAADALTEPRLANKVALAITPAGDVALPVR